MLPLELVFDILSIAILLHPQPASVLASSHFYNLSLPLLYHKLHFTSYRQIAKFLQTYGLEPIRVPYPPRAIELDLDNNASMNVFSQLRDLFLTCSLARGTEVDEQGRLVLDSPKLRLHSLSQDPNPGSIYNTLRSINPRKFIWTGRDPLHHFSIAIVPQVLPYLFRALASYTYLSHVELTHLSFGSSEDTLKFPSIPSLQEIYIGQATFVSPSMVGAYLLSPGSEQLQRVRLVDTYVESIWGLRLRRSDIEKAVMAHVLEKIWDEDAMSHFLAERAAAKATEVVKRLMACEGKTERIIGGDRFTDT